MYRIILFTFLTFTLQAQSLLRSTPQKEKVSELYISSFIEEWESNRVHEPHSLMLLKNGKVVFEKWWKPFQADYLHTMYSVSKTFTSTAIGLAVQEGKLSIDDAVIGFFPDKLSASISPHLKNLKVKHLLTMSTGHTKEPIEILYTQDWVKGFLASDFSKEPGSHFLYNSTATYMLSAILKKVTGLGLIDYLNPRLFQPLGIKNVDWEKDPSGIELGGWGLRLHTEDMAKLGLLYLNKGKWNGQQILSEDWVKTASSAIALQDPSLPKEVFEKSDWHQGYGYQMWRGRHNTFRADGAYGQNIILGPDKDAVIITTGESADLQGLLNLIWDHLLPALDNKNPGSYKAKEKFRLIPCSSKTKGNLTQTKFNFLEKPYEDWESFSINPDKSLLEINTTNHTYRIKLGHGKWTINTSHLRSPSLFRVGDSYQKKAHKIAANYAWEDKNKLKVELKFIEGIHTETFIIDFVQKTLSLKNIVGGGKTFRIE